MRPTSRVILSTAVILALTSGLAVAQEEEEAAEEPSSDDRDSHFWGGVSNSIEF